VRVRGLEQAAGRGAGVLGVPGTEPWAG
jgi:hypothetical protein